LEITRRGKLNNEIELHTLRFLGIMIFLFQQYILFLSKP